MKPVVYLTSTEVMCPCGRFLNVNIKVPLLKRSCWDCNRVIEVRLSGSSVSAWCEGQKIAITVIAQKRQEQK